MIFSQLNLYKRCIIMNANGKIGGLMRFERMKKLLDQMQEHKLEGMAFNPGPTLAYLTGMHFHLMERPTLLMVKQKGEAAIILPELEKGKLPPETDVIRAFTYGDNPDTWKGVFNDASSWLALNQGNVGVAPNRIRFMELRFLEEAFPGVEFVDGSKVIENLRMIKDEDEIRHMRAAAQIAQKALLELLRLIRGGMTEKAIANELVVQLLRAGSSPKLPFQPIVSIGENAANPHAVPSERSLTPGDVLLIDYGASYEGYLSDITRTFTFGEVDEELLHIGRIVLEANRAGRLAGKPGLDVGEVDRAARAVITDAGYGHAFIHRTGHGLGMEAHEPPYVFGENRRTLIPGMTFTVEPGIYLPGKGGVRIEDDVVVRSPGLESLSDLSRDLHPLEEFFGG
jgi:Xaa-Pro dipeptidase